MIRISGARTQVPLPTLEGPPQASIAAHGGLRSEVEARQAARNAHSALRDVPEGHLLRAGLELLAGGRDELIAAFEGIDHAANERSLTRRTAQHPLISDTAVYADGTFYSATRMASKHSIDDVMRLWVPGPEGKVPDWGKFWTSGVTKVDQQTRTIDIKMLGEHIPAEVQIQFDPPPAGRTETTVDGLRTVRVNAAFTGSFEGKGYFEFAERPDGGSDVTLVWDGFKANGLPPEIAGILHSAAFEALFPVLKKTGFVSAEAYLDKALSSATPR